MEERATDTKRNLIVTTLVALLMAGFVLGYTLLVPSRAQSGMEASDDPRIPSVRGYVEGEQVLFLHTEASDPDIAGTLTDMMGSPVLVVPSLADAPESMLADVYVFSNGVQGMGPLGFQPDVFNAPPMTDRYSPLREVKLVTWRNAGSARELTSATAVLDAADRGDVTIERSGVVVNMPMVTWPGGTR